MDTKSLYQADGEEQLVARAAKGDREAFGFLYDKYHASIYRFILLRVGRREDAEDLAHQAFMNAWERMPQYEARGFPFGSWLYRIARNGVIDHYRTKKPDVSLESVDPDLFASAPDLPFAVDQAIELGRVHRALSMLKPEYQEVIIMRFVEELSLKETAQAMRRSEGAIKLLQHRALQALRESLGDPSVA